MRPRVFVSAGVPRSRQHARPRRTASPREFVKLTGTKMGEPSGYRVIVDRISHEVEYFRAYLKHAVLEGTYVINNPFWWTADDKFFNYSVAQKLGVAVPKTVVLPQKAYPADIDLDPRVAAQPRLSDRLGRAARLRRPSGDPEAVFGRRLEARLQGERPRRAARRLRRHRAVLHDAAAVHPLRSVRPLLHVRQDRHRAGRLRSAPAPLPRASTTTCRRSSARASSATRRR